ncbi:hypothetical protein GQX73_g2854 [Xylaria multiplex]|uniref:Phosphoglycerate mutase n=1 Tax=Xylaria multiplex TaxID=323545 RepID=A0A7C8IUT3_9PEZI|nr:hypothetical protein GQX73_g2854 [Xylaria multiplex]
MGRPPAYIFVVRHGKRLDAADKQWHLTSPTPYDPPLTYGGWMHSRTVGARIATILRDEAEADAAIDTPSEYFPSMSTFSSPSPSRKRRRFRVVIHSSPFLRCVQTSIAISAGLASNPTLSTAPSTNITSPLSPPSQPVTLQSTQASPFSNPVPTTTRPDVPIPASASSHDTSDPHKHVEKAVLRLDAFLGEWLSPDYFEHITPPPKSALMLATAKAELLRRSSYHDYPHFHVRVHSTASSQLWGNLSSHHGIPGTPPVHGPHSISSLDTLSHLANSLPGHEGGSNGHSNSKEYHHPPGYVFPVPSYAISTSEPIPKGYVAHARDACVSIDYQWDSSRDNLAWGDGGTLPEEWAAMHQRFRKGLRRLVDWYGSTENAGQMVTKTAHVSHPPESDCAVIDDDDEEGEIEDVVVLVSHGAGCNALIGALTQQPVLADIAMSSLTIAKRRADFDPRNISLTREKSLTSLHAALPMSRATMPQMYELKLFANTDHLSTPSASRSASLTGPNHRARGSTGFTSALKEINFGSLYGGSPSPGGSPRQSSNASLGSMRRSPGVPSLVMGPSVYNANTGGITIGSGMSSFSVTRPDRSGSGTWGLWSPKQEDNDHDKEPETPMLLDFSHEKSIKDKEVKDTTSKDEKDEKPGLLIASDKSAETTTTADEKSESTTSDENVILEPHDEEHDKFDQDLVPRLWAGTGLWGAPRPPGEAERLRDFSAHKRRWTVTER